MPAVALDLMALAAHGLALRPIQAADAPLLYRIYASTRAAELAPLGWTVEQQTAFLQMQFQAQHTYYQQQFPTASYEVIEQAGTPIGRLYLERRPAEVAILDIALLPNSQRRGLGALLLRQIQQAAAALALPVMIYVEHVNPALRLYQRLGFQPVEDQGVYLLMKWTPEI